MPRLRKSSADRHNRVGPTHHARRRAGSRRHPQKIAAMHDAIAIRSGVNMMLQV